MLTFNLKKEWFEKIKSGEKTHEYRMQSKYWISRISNFLGYTRIKERLSNAINTGDYFTFETDAGFPYSRAVCFCCGYPKKDDKTKRVYGLITRISANIDGRMTDLEINEPVFDIEFKLIKEGWEVNV